MTNKLYIKGNNKNYLSAIRRFLKYVLITDSAILEKKSVLDKSTVLIDEDSPINRDWREFLHKYSNEKIVILGISRKSNEVYVNLLDLSHLKNNFQNALNSNKKGKYPLLLLKNVEKQIRFLFKSHVEESLFDLLNMIRNSVSDAQKLLKKNVIDWNGYKKAYLNPGIKNWEAFKRRFRKHKNYLKVCGFDNEIDEIESNINNIQQYIDKLKTMTKDQVNRLNEDEIRLNADHLKNVDYILTKIKQQIDSIYNDK